VKVLGSNNRYALFMTVVMSSAIAACSGDDDDMLTGTGGMGGAGTVTDAGRDAHADSSAGDADSAPDGLGSDARGGAGGSGGNDGAGPDISVGGAAGVAGSDGSAGSDGTAGSDGAAGTGGDAGPEATSRDALPDTLAHESGPDVGGDVSLISDASDAGAVDQDAAVTSDASDASPPSTADADADAPAQIPPDGAHSVCTAPGGTPLFLFDSADSADGWEFNTGTMLGGGGYLPPPGTPNPTWNDEDGCPGLGQLRFTIPFDSLAGSSDGAGVAHPQGVHFTYDLSNQDWTNNTVIHLKLKVETAGGLEFIQPYIDLSSPSGGPPVMNPDGSNDYTAEILGVGTWRELLINLPHVDAGSLVPARFGFELYSKQPGTVSFVIDSIWIE
jgi:hypothetical protein